MLNRLELKNFKSAHDLGLRLAPLTVLTGLNGSGKSTVLQALALLKQSLTPPSRGDYQLLLRGAIIKLGRVEDVRSENSKEDEINISVSFETQSVLLNASAVKGADTLPLTVEGDIQGLAEVLQNGFQYIQADRITPARRYDLASTPDRLAGWLGCDGEFTVDYLHLHQDDTVSRGRQLVRDDDNFPPGLLDQVAPTTGLLDQVAGWLQYLSPGVRPKPLSIDAEDAASLNFTYTGTGVYSSDLSHRPINVGFGLTYSLPIIVACLSAPKGALVLLENPEAHLHPRGQAALGKLLAMAANDGVQIIVETHSDHLLNGIRVAAKQKIIENPSQSVALHFFTRDVESGDSSVQSPTLLQNGKLSEWPDGFLDEWSIALDKLLED